MPEIRESLESGSIVIKGSSDNIEFFIPENPVEKDKGIIRYDNDSKELHQLPFKKLDSFSIEKRKWGKIIGWGIIALAFVVIMYGVITEILQRFTRPIASAIITLGISGIVMIFYQKFWGNISSILRKEGLEIMFQGDVVDNPNRWAIPLENVDDKGRVVGLLRKGIERNWNSKSDVIS